MAGFSTKQKMFVMTFEALGNSKRLIEDVSKYYKERTPVFQKNLSSDLKKRVPGIIQKGVSTKYMINKSDVAKRGQFTILSSDRGAAIMVRGSSLTPRAYTPRTRPAPGRSYQIRVRIFRRGKPKTLGGRQTVARVEKHRLANRQVRIRSLPPKSPSPGNVFLAIVKRGLPWMPVELNAKKTLRTIRSVSVPQMVDGSEDVWRRPVDVLVDKRIAHHMRRLGL